MPVDILLLGSPRFSGRSSHRTLAGRKTWALLAYLLVEPSPPTRREIAQLLYSSTDDPLAAQRWSLLQIRRALGDTANIDEIEGRLVISDIDLEVDTTLLLAGEVAARDVETVLRGDLLEGYSFPNEPAFETWLLLQRSRVRSASGEAARWAANALVGKDLAAAFRLVERALRDHPFDDALHESMVSFHVKNGDPASGESYFKHVDRQYHDELGQPAPLSIRRPLVRAEPEPGEPLISHGTEARTLLRSSRARFKVGDYEGSLITAERASSSATRSGDRPLEVESSIVLAEILIHSLRGRDQEAVGLLDRALSLAVDLGMSDVVSDAERELGFVAFLRAEYGAAEPALARATRAALGCADHYRVSKAVVFQGLCQSDRCDYGLAEKSLEEALALLATSDARTFRAYTLACLARIHVLQEDFSAGIATAAQAVEEARAAAAHSILPWGLVWAGEAERGEGNAGLAGEYFDEAYALGREIGDPCWEALALRGLAGMQVDGGNPGGAIQLLAGALECCRRYTDIYKWAEAAVLVDLVTLQKGEEEEHVARAAELAYGGPMPDLVRRLEPFLVSQTPLQTGAE